MGLLDKLLNKDGDGEADSQTRDWLSKVDEQITESTGAGTNPPPPPAPVPEALQAAAINAGPAGDIIDHLHVLHLDEGATWAEVREAHATAIAGVGDYGDVEERRRFNSAYAALRLHG